MFEGLLEVIVRHADHGETLLNGTRVPGYSFGTGIRVLVRDGYPGTRIPGYPVRKPRRVFGSDPEPVTGRACPVKLAGYAVPTRTGGTPTQCVAVYIAKPKITKA